MTRELIRFDRGKNPLLRFHRVDICAAVCCVLFKIKSRIQSENQSCGFGKTWCLLVDSAVHVIVENQRTERGTAAISSVNLRGGIFKLTLAA